MAYKPLTEEGKKFIRKICNGIGNTLLQGKNKDGVLPNCIPATPFNKIWISNAKFNGNIIYTNQQLGEALIIWYNKYAELYQMDANVMAAQAFQESGYAVWAYPLTSSASGIGQFTSDTILDFIILNKFSSIVPQTFTQQEINAITKNVIGLINDRNTYSHNTTLGQQNRPIIHQNVTDNPEIMIKAQFRYMKYIASLCNSLTSGTLFGYFAGPPAKTKLTYTDVIRDSKNTDTIQTNGIDYVFKIFSILGDKNNELVRNKPQGYYFGYDFLGMNKNNVFDEYMAQTVNSEIKNG